LFRVNLVFLSIFLVLTPYRSVVQIMSTLKPWLATSLPPVSLLITGASGIPYALGLLKALAKVDLQVHVVISSAALVVFSQETSFKIPAKPALQKQKLCEITGMDDAKLQVYSQQDWMSPLASGSAAPKTTIICPCSMATLSAIATGSSNNLIERNGDVVLKERGKLILVPRETPYNQIHLQHMLSLTQMGAVIMPASPGFYHNPQCIDDLIDFMVARMLDHLGLDQQLVNKWGYANQ
jgi:flavin prenyltransferase